VRKIKSLEISYAEPAVADLDFFLQNLTEVYDEQFARRKITSIMDEVSTLSLFSSRCPLLSELYGIEFDSPYRRLLFNPYVIIYLVIGTTVNIIRIFHEKEDYLSILL